MTIPAFPHDELAGVRELLEELVTALDDEPAPHDAAAVEMLALGVQAAFALPDAPADLARELPAALARRGDELAADLLVAIERLAPEPLAGLAAEQRMRLEASGVVAPHAAHIGAAELAEALVLRMPDGPAEVLHAVLRRPDSELRQTLAVFVEHEPCGAVVFDVVAADPGDGDLARHLRDRGAEPLAAPELLRRLRAALEHMERHAVPLTAEAASALPLLERVLTGSVGRLPRPPVGPPAADEDDAEALVDAFAAALQEDEDADAALRERGPFVAHCMLEWKLGYGGGALLHWTLGDLRELMLDWFPGEVTVEEETVSIAAEAIARFLRFLADGDLLDAPVPLGSLEAAVQRLRPRFEQACRDSRRWGPAKGLLAEMAADGVDLADERAVQTWIEGYNGRAFDERGAVAPARAPAAKRAKRKAARRARRRNRH
jgi:hypothetical protein